MPFLATVPILVPDERLIGTAAFGVWKCLSPFSHYELIQGTDESFVCDLGYENTGHVIISVTAGAIHDLTPTGTNS